ncbi:hypothetical protein ACFLXE_03940 [Chloroflexota bacterium]
MTLQGLEEETEARTAIRSDERSRLLEVQSLLAEYEAGQNDILDSRRRAGMLADINIVAVGVIVGLIAAVDIYDFGLVLVMSLLSSSLGLFWIAQNRRGLASSSYILNVILPRLRSALGEEAVPGGESGAGLPISGFFPDVAREIAGLDDRGRSPDRSSRSSLLGGGKESQAHKRPGSPDLLGGIIEFLTFLLPSLGGLIVGVYGMVSSEPWYGYCTVLLIMALALAAALSFGGWRLYLAARQQFD